MDAAASVPERPDLALDRALAPSLLERRAAGLLRVRRTLGSPQGVQPVVDGRVLLSFCSNDYLGLASHPEVVAAFRLGARRWGVGSGASHLVSGHLRPHAALEEDLAELTGRPRALVFSTGYMANLAVASTLAGHRDSVFEDRLNHASLVDGGLLARSRLYRYPHADAEALTRQLERAGAGRRVVLTDGVFSMDGDLAPLTALASAAAAHAAWLVVDDAHGLGVVGRSGRGSLEHFGLDLSGVPVLIGTLGKAFGTAGAFVAGSDTLIEALVQWARPYVYTTALPPAIAVATRASLRLARAGEARERLQSLIARYRRGAAELSLPATPSVTAIQPLVLGSAERAVLASRALEARGLLIPAIRPPTVPASTARLRVTLSAAHREEHVDRLLDALAQVLR
jgi:8-amino-7-oxononanoate synthase